MFLLCNNGITVVCEEFDQIRDKLVKIENPQIVNGCQTSNCIFSLRSHANIDRIQLLVRVICTENRLVSNRIVRGTNRQNQVLEEAFEATLPFHQEVLEPYFAACSDPVKLYYERRARQYDNDPLVKRTHVVNLRILTQTFVGMFLDAPHESHRHEAKLLEKYAGESGTRKVFRNDHSPAPYFACGVAWYMLERWLREELIDRKYRIYKAHLLMVLRYGTGIHLPKLVKSRTLDGYCETLLSLLREPKFNERIRDVLKVFDNTLSIWTAQGGSRYGIKDNEKFTELLIAQSRQRFFTTQPPEAKEDDRNAAEGRILRIAWRDGLWFGFIKRAAELENVYVDSRGFRGDPELLAPETRVRFEIGKRDRGLFARNVAILDSSHAAGAYSSNVKASVDC
jgi:cold shock CspA family protein